MDERYHDMAQALIEQIRAMRLVIPNFAIPAKGDGRRLVSVATLPFEFIELAAVAIANNEVLVRGTGLPPDDMRGLVQFAEAFEAFASELEAMCVFVRHSATAARAKAGREALTTYLLAQRAAKRPETADLAPIVEALRRALGKRIRTGKRGEGKEK